jgi:hypothetical protein
MSGDPTAAFVDAIEGGPAPRLGGRPGGIDVVTSHAVGVDPGTT